MAFLSDLWLPILLSAIYVFFASSILHMVIPLHRSDYKTLPSEDKLREAMRSASIPPGTYFFPNCPSMKDMGTPEMVAKFKEGPVGFMTVVPTGVPGMGKQLSLWFLYCILAAVGVAYLAHTALPAGSEYLSVFGFCAVAGVMAYGMGSMAESIWKAQPWRTTAKFIFDAFVYALGMAGIFGWRWPDAI